MAVYLCNPSLPAELSAALDWIELENAEESAIGFQNHSVLYGEVTVRFPASLAHPSAQTPELPEMPLRGQAVGTTGVAKRSAAERVVAPKGGASCRDKLLVTDHDVMCIDDRMRSRSEGGALMSTPTATPI
jgi:hypothetical protein